jgi:hypothetical protein
MSRDATGSIMFRPKMLKNSLMLACNKDHVNKDLKSHRTTWRLMEYQV